MRRILIAAALILSALAIGSTVKAQQLVPFCGGKFDLCGYYDRRTKQQRIAPRFERALPFVDGWAVVRINGRYGFIDEQGEIVVEPKFDMVGDFYQGLAEVLIDKQVGVIDRSGKIVVQPTFKRAVPFTRDVILVVEGVWKPAPGGSEKLSTLRYTQLQNAGLYHVSGRWIRRPDLARVSVFEAEGKGLIWASERADPSGPYGLLASDGTWVIEPKYEFPQALRDGLAVVRQKVDGQDRYGAVDASGKLVVPIEYESLGGWFPPRPTNGFLIARGKGKEGLVDRSGKLYADRYFDKIEDIVSGVPIVRVDDRLVGIDRDGSIIPHPNNGRIYFSCPEGVRLIEMHGKLQVTNAAGEQTVSGLVARPPSRPNCRFPTAVSDNDKLGPGKKWFFIKPDGSEFPDQPRFDSVFSFTSDATVVGIGGKWGLVDQTGKFVVPLEYETFSMHEGNLIFTFIRQGNRTTFNVKGEEVSAPEVKQLVRGPDALSCGHGLKIVERDGLWGIVDADGAEIVAPRYRAIDCFRHGVAWVPIDEKRQWCPAGIDGKVREEPDCRPIHYPYFQTHSYPEKFSEDHFESSVLWMQAYLQFGVGKRETPPRWVSDSNRPYSIHR